MTRKGFRMASQTDEIVSVSNKVKMRDYQSAAVILDFKERRVLQASMQGNTIPRDWDKIRDFYHQHYPKIIGDLEAFYGHKAPDPVEPTADTDPVSN